MTQGAKTADIPAVDDPRAQQAMSWYGFGSPVGLAILIISIGVSALCLRIAFFGLPG